MNEQLLKDDRVCQQGTPVTWTSSGNIRELYYSGYTIVYEITENKVIIHEVYNQNKIYLRYGKRKQ